MARRVVELVVGHAAGGAVAAVLGWQEGAFLEVRPYTEKGRGPLRYFWQAKHGRSRGAVAAGSQMWSADKEVRSSLMAAAAARQFTLHPAAGRQPQTPRWA